MDRPKRPLHAVLVAAGVVAAVAIPGGSAAEPTATIASGRDVPPPWQGHTSASVPVSTAPAATSPNTNTSASFAAPLQPPQAPAQIARRRELGRREGSALLGALQRVRGNSRSNLGIPCVREGLKPPASTRFTCRFTAAHALVRHGRACLRRVQPRAREAPRPLASAATANGPTEHRPASRQAFSRIGPMWWWRCHSGLRAARDIGTGSASGSGR